MFGLAVDERAAAGDESAMAVGVRTTRLRGLLLVLASLLTGAIVAVSGGIGFVGSSPHMARLLVGSDHRRMLPITVLGGALFLMVADLLPARPSMPTEIPLGILTAVRRGSVLPVVDAQRRRAGGVHPMSVLFDDVSVARGGRTVLHGVDLEVVPRDRDSSAPTAAASPRLLRALFTGQRPHAGRATWIDGADVSQLAPRNTCTHRVCHAAGLCPSSI